MPEIYNSIEIKFYLLKRLLGVKKDGGGEHKLKVTVFSFRFTSGRRHEIETPFFTMKIIFFVFFSLKILI